MGDEQAGHEKTMSMMLAALSGANMIYGLGMLNLGMTMDFAQLVVDNEIAKMTRKVLGGINVNDETMAVDVIRSVGANGHFLTAEHTRKHMKIEQSHSDLFDRKSYNKWKEDGGLPLDERAQEKAKKILAEHRAKELPKETKDKLNSIIEQAAEEMGVKWK